MALDDDDQTQQVERRNAVQRALIARVAKEAAREAGARAGRRAAWGYVALFVVLLIGATVYSTVQEGKLRSGLLAACDRVNNLRIDESNRNAQVLYAAFYHAREREQGLTKQGMPVNRQLHKESVTYLTTTIGTLRWTPRTDCSEAVRHARHYKAPMPRRFTRKYLDLGVIPE